MADPAAEAIPNSPGGIGDPGEGWAAMTPGQRVTFVQAAAQRGLYPVGAVNYWSAQIPEFSPGSPGSSTGSTASIPLPGLDLFKFPELPSNWKLWLACALVVAGAIILKKKAA